MKFSCAHCGATSDKRSGDVNRARNAGLNLYCNRKCAGLGRRTNKPKADKIQEKRLYDMAYRANNRAILKAKKVARHRLTYNADEAAIKRKQNMPRHVEYCRRPEYKRWKSTYDRKYRAEKDYGPFAEAAMLALDLNFEIKGRMTNEQINQENDTFNKSQKRRRATSEETSRSRPRHRDRRPGHSASNGG